MTVAPGFVINGGDEEFPLGVDRVVSWQHIATAMQVIP